MTDQPPNYPPPPGGYGYPPPPGGYGYPPPGPPGYGYSPPGYPLPPGARTNTMAIAALVSSLVGLLCLGIGPILGLVFGIIALNQIKQSGEDGRGLAIAGIAISGCEIALLVILLFIGAIASRNDETHHHRYHRSEPAMVAFAEPQSISCYRGAELGYGSSAISRAFLTAVAT